MTSRHKSRLAVIRAVREVLLRFAVPCALSAVTSGCVARATPPLPAAARTAPAITLGEILLRDDFADPAEGRLPLKSTHPGAEQGYFDGEYLVSLSAIAKSGVHVVAADPTFANTHVAVDVRVAEELEPSWVGLACRVTGDAPGFYSLDVVPATGRVVLARHDPERTVFLVSKRYSGAVRRGNATNHLELTCIGSNIRGRINGTEVALAQDSSYDRGHVGILVARGETPSMRAWFDNLVVREALFEP